MYDVNHLVVSGDVLGIPMRIKTGDSMTATIKIRSNPFGEDHRESVYEIACHGELADSVTKTIQAGQKILVSGQLEQCIIGDKRLRIVADKVQRLI